MYKKILVPIALDHERDTAKALKFAAENAESGAEIIALNVIEEIPAYVANYIPEGYAKTLHDEFVAELQKEIAGAPNVTPVVVRGHAGRTIVDYAVEHGVDCIVIASHRPGLQDYFIGSTALRVVKHAPCAVHVVR